MTYGIYPYTKATRLGAKNHILEEVTTFRKHFVVDGVDFSNGWIRMTMA